MLVILNIEYEYVNEQKRAIQRQSVTRNRKLLYYFEPEELVDDVKDVVTFIVVVVSRYWGIGVGSVEGIDMLTFYQLFDVVKNLPYND